MTKENQNNPVVETSTVPIYESPFLVYESPKLQRNSLLAAAQVALPPAQATPDHHYVVAD